MDRIRGLLHPVRKLLTRTHHWGPGVSFKNFDVESALHATLQHVDESIQPVGYVEDYGLRRALKREKTGSIEPEYEIEYGGRSLYVSDPFIHMNNHRTVAAWIPKERGKFERMLFYKSFSHGVWRLLPYYVPRKEGGERISKLDSGRPPAEEYATLPIFLQMALSRIESGFTKPDMLLAHWNKRQYPPQNEDSRALTEHIQKVDEPAKQRQFTQEQEAAVPLDLEDARLHPDFERLQHVFMSQDPFQDELDSPVTGNRMGFVFPSKDGSRRYLFFLDDAGRTWSAFHEFAQSPLTRHGLNRHISTAPAEHFRPAFDYKSKRPEGSAISDLEPMGALAIRHAERRSYFDYSKEVHAGRLVAPFRQWLRQNGFKIWDADQIHEDLRETRHE